MQITTEEGVPAWSTCL